MTDPARGRVITAFLFLALTFSALVPVRSYDLFWHLASGRWIVEHRAIPQSDPFAIATDRVPWVDGEWLFQIGAFAVHAWSGDAGLSWARALLVAMVFASAFAFAKREGGEDAALLLTVLAFAAASPLIDFRPSGVAALFVVLAIVTRSPLRYAILTVVWINTHPSALLAPWIALVRDAGELPPSRWLRLPLHKPAFAVSAAALLINPYGIAGVTSPLALMSWVRSGAFVNAEWLPSRLQAHPLFYIAIACAIAIFAIGFRRSDAWRMVLLASLAFLAVRHVRNQPLFLAAFPLLVAPSAREWKLRRSIAWLASAAGILFVAIGGSHRTGIPTERFPVDAVARLKKTGLAGNIYNPDQFGGFLIWSFYPQRRVLTDGRNELYRTYIPEYARARGDERAWRALLKKYRIDLAVDEYRPPLPVIESASGKRTLMPASLAYWPREHWALIAFDDAGMVFARREAFPAALLRKWEIDRVVPDASRVSSPSRAGS